jgi:hypothetical protein
LEREQQGMDRAEAASPKAELVRTLCSSSLPVFSELEPWVLRLCRAAEQELGDGFAIAFTPTQATVTAR